MSREFATLSFAALSFFLSYGVIAPVLPRYVEKVLGGSTATVGLVAGALAIGAVVSRPRIGRIGDRKGRRWLLRFGSGVTSCALLAQLLADSVPSMLAIRLIAGVGQAAMFVGSTSLAVDLAPPSRVGEAASYVLVANNVGVGTGPLIGDLLRRSVGYDGVWIAAAAAAGVAFVLVLTLPARLPAPRAALAPGEVARPVKAFHPAGLRPGIVLGFGMLGITGFYAFIPLFGDKVGMHNVAPVFLLSSMTIVVVRLIFRRLPDRAGPIRTATVALGFLAAGMAGFGFVHSSGGVYAMTFVLAIGGALFMPGLLPAAVDIVPEDERSSALATFTLFIDLSAGVGGVVFGAIAGATSYGTAFLSAGVMTLVALLLLYVVVAPHLKRGARVVELGELEPGTTRTN